MNKKHLLAVGVAAFAIVASLTIVDEAEAESHNARAERFPILALSDSHGDDAEIVSRQNILVPAAMAIDARAGQVDGRFNLVRINALDMSLTIYRQSGLGGLATSAYDDLIPAGVVLRFEQAILSHQQETDLHDAFASALPLLETQGIELTTRGPEEVGGKFVVGFDPEHLPASADVIRRLHIDTMPAEAFDQRLVEYAPRDPSVSVNGTRSIPTNPFWGGAKIHAPIDPNNNNAFVICSSGFAARSYNNSYYYLLTAAHCYWPSNTVMYSTWGGGGYVNLGNVTTTDLHADAALIRLRSPNISTPRIFNGQWGTSGQDTQNWSVVSWEQAHVGELICTSGARSYNRCDGIVDLAVSWTSTNAYSHATSTSYGYRAISADEQSLLAAKSDSGGPVYRITGTGTVSAVGLISALPAGYNITCPSYAAGPGIKCSYAVYFGDIWHVYQTNDVYFNGW